MRMKKYVFICEHNFTRSKYGAEFFNGFLEGKNKKAKVESAGLGFLSIFLGRRINKKILSGSDFVFVMERWMKNYLVEKFNFNSSKIVVLGIKDEYGFLRSKNILDLDKKLKQINWSRYL